VFGARRIRVGGGEDHARNPCNKEVLEGQDSRAFALCQDENKETWEEGNQSNHRSQADFWEERRQDGSSSLSDTQSSGWTSCKAVRQKIQEVVAVALGRFRKNRKLPYFLEDDYVGGDEP